MEKQERISNVWEDIMVMKKFMAKLPHTENLEHSDSVFGRIKERIKDIYNG